ncbi:hydrogenase maturation protease [Chloroflexus sp.]|uniref:hydrogenase maturation protease n=1 Tax=Chloroflexus sp. TaxID=1904827 RepID=UPI00298ED419|nr:hydrogenase maturation protease [Chloroflexus sp.]MCS6886940.1 hydrogenase maturation protease [Chloroflexus sp.]MCX7859866.1 hydrogenase maturation protease [Chloroflexus sp.]MDW8403340.1 hydrogenase maturation protease [Chloroflexus sp.]
MKTEIMESWLLELTAQGYLHLPAALAQRYFPADLLVALPRDGEVWLVPLRGPAAGGLLLKQRNARGDRSVLIWEALPPATPPGLRRAVWDERNGALRMALQPEPENVS